MKLLIFIFIVLSLLVPAVEAIAIAKGKEQKQKSLYGSGMMGTHNVQGERGETSGNKRTFADPEKQLDARDEPGPNDLPRDLPQKTRCRDDAPCNKGDRCWDCYKKCDGLTECGPMLSVFANNNDCKEESGNLETKCCIKKKCESSQLDPLVSEAILCSVDEYVSSNKCTSCAVGSTNDAGNDASGSDTTCTEKAVSTKLEQTEEAVSTTREIWWREEMNAALAARQPDVKVACESTKFYGPCCVVTEEKDPSSPGVVPPECPNHLDNFGKCPKDYPQNAGYTPNFKGCNAPAHVQPPLVVRCCATEGLGGAISLQIGQE